MEFQYWILFYAVPAGIATYLTSKQTSSKSRMFTVHTLVALSVILLTSAGVNLEWNFNIWQFMALGLSILFSIYLLGLLGLIYVASSAVQEFCLLLASVLIMPVVGLLWSAVATALVYTLAHFAHQQDRLNWRLKFPLVFLWGLISIILYFYLEQPLLNIALHTSLGAILIRRGILYRV